LLERNFDLPNTRNFAQEKSIDHWLPQNLEREPNQMDLENFHFDGGNVSQLR
jgi:hypothetical protein